MYSIKVYWYDLQFSVNQALGFLIDLGATEWIIWVLTSLIYQAFWQLPLASFTNKVNPRLAKRPLDFNGRLANRGLTSLIKEATGLIYRTETDSTETFPWLLYQWQFAQRYKHRNLGPCLLLHNIIMWNKTIFLQTETVWIHKNV